MSWTGWLSLLLALLLLAALGAVLRLRRALHRARDEVLDLRADLERVETTLPERRRSRAVRRVVGTAVESAARLREGGVSGLLMSSIEDLTTWALEDRRAISRLAADDGTVSVLFSDIVDSTSLNERLGDEEWIGLLDAHDRLVRRCVTEHRGHIVKSQGDGFMIAFGDPAEAVRAGIQIQDALGEADDQALRRTPIRVRVGIHTGPVVERDGDIFGRNVALAARVASQAGGGQILVSDDVRQVLRDAEDIVLVDFREAELKGLPGRHRLWQVALI